MKKMMSIKTYSELISIPLFIDRVHYLRLNGSVGIETFGFDRYLNQALYKSNKWNRVRDKVIIRDNGCDLGVNGYEIYDRILIHHINPISIDDILNDNPMVFDLNNLICTSHRTHNAIHYGSDDLLFDEFVERKINDTIPWK